MNKKAYLLVNFGGPRAISEIRPFLSALLTDPDVIRTKMPMFLQNILFKRVARKRAISLKKDYELIGGSSPIYKDTEACAEKLRKKLNGLVLTFHRYLPSTHEDAFRKLHALEAEEIIVFPFFPQFTYATTGSLARIFRKYLPLPLLSKLHWIKSYPKHPAYISLFVNDIREYMILNNLQYENTIFLFSAHGLPESFIKEGDPYQYEVESTYREIMDHFPNVKGRLCYQSRFGPEEWLKPYTMDLCETIGEWHEGRENILFIPISFTSDHIETLFEVEHQYMPVIREQGLKAYRLPAFNQRDEWVEVMWQIMEETIPIKTSMLIR